LHLLLVEDDRIVRVTVRDALADAGYDVAECADGAAAASLLESRPFDLVLCDVRLPGMDGVSLFRRARALQPAPAVVLMTAYASTEDAVAVMREGARDYVLKPFEMDELLLRLGRVRDELLLRRRVEEGAPVAEGDLESLAGDSPAMRLVRERVEAAAAGEVAVLLVGETGTGKDLAARLVHARSRRARRPFVAVNCAAVPEALFEAEMFGHEKGAFTGADRRRQGRFEAADGGTLFLDEVGELAPSCQAKLLRAVETSSFEPVGSSRTVHVDVRVIAATNRDLAGPAAQGGFRRDLYYRLNVVDVRLPPLREHRQDVLPLAGRFLRDIAARQERPMPELEPAAAAALEAWDWPGNVRELVHALERAVALSRGAPLAVHHLPDEIAASAVPAAPSAALQPLERAVGDFERRYIERALEHTGGHRGRAAALLGISRKSLWERLRDAPPAACAEGTTRPPKS